MNEVERAIIIAAGKGTRLYPVTDKTPKPLVKVNGVRMIDTALRGLIKNGITEIYIVVGYMADQFEELKTEYPEITLIENPYYDECNNISSLYVAREHLKNVLIMDGDQIIKDSSVLFTEFDKSGYNATWTEDFTNEWLMQVENDVVVSCSRNGGDKGWQLFGISRWNDSDAIKLKKYLEIEFIEKNNRDIYWDDIPMFYYFDEFSIGIFEMDKDCVVEIDSLQELMVADASYRGIDGEGNQ